MNPTARQEQLIVEHVSDETLVYDQNTDEAHALDVKASQIWCACTGAHSVAEIAERTGSEPAVVIATLDELERLGLLLERPKAGFTRRRQLQMVAAAGAALVLPTIKTVSVANAVQAAGTCLSTGAPCMAPADCCSNVCTASVCG